VPNFLVMFTTEQRSAGPPANIGLGTNLPLSCETPTRCGLSARSDAAKVQRAERRRRSLEASGPHLIISGASAIGALCRQ
jgi:hypothetical protein